MKKFIAVPLIARRLCFAAMAFTVLCPVAHAQRPAPVVKPIGRRQPVPIFRLDADDAAPTRVELQSRMTKSITASGRTMTPKSNGVFEVKPINQEVLNSMMTPEQQKAAAEKAKAKADAKKKKAADKKQAEEDAKIQAAVEKALAEDEAKDQAAQAAAEAAKLKTLSAKQPESADGNAYLSFVAPDKVDIKNNTVLFRVTGEQTKKDTYYTYFVPNNYLQLALNTQAGKTYLITVESYWTPGFGGPGALVGTGIAVYSPWYQGSGTFLDGYLLTIGVGELKTGFVVSSTKDGWYNVNFAGIKNWWEFRGLTVKEITP